MEAHLTALLELALITLMMQTTIILQLLANKPQTHNMQRDIHSHWLTAARAIIQRSLPLLCSLMLTDISAHDLVSLKQGTSHAMNLLYDAAEELPNHLEVRSGIY